MADNDKDEDLVMVGDGVDGEAEVVVQVDDDGDGDEQLAGQGQDLEAHPDDDSRIGGGEADEDDVKEQKRLERKSRRQRQKEARERDKRELEFLRKRNDQVERQLTDLTRRVTANETSQIDARIAQLETGIKKADDVYAQAISAGEGDDAAEAMRIRDQLKDQRDGLKAYKEQGEQAPQQEGPDPRLVEHVRQWHSRNDWFDFGRRDQDSAIAGAIDDSLALEGWDPTTPEYYAELDKRISAMLPHRAGKGGQQRGNGADDDYDDDDGQTQQRQQRQPTGPKFRVGGKERPLKSNEVHISKERREAMIEAGVWDDPKTRARYLKRYQEYDREQAQNES